MDDKFELIKKSEIINICFKIESPWQNDNDVTQCNKCKITFSWFYRRHHCYLHGLVFCSNCVKNRVDIYTDPLGDRYIDILPYRNNSTIKVCDVCYSILKYKQKSAWLPLAFYLLPIKDIISLTSTCKLWNLITKNYLTIYINIKHQIPSQPLTQLQSHILYINKNSFAGHTSWLIPLYKSFPMLDINLFDSQKIKSCKSLNCSNSCYEKLQCYHLVDLLINSQCEPQLLSYIYSSFDKIPNFEFDFYIPIFTKIINKYSSFLDYLIKRSNDNIQIATSCYFQLLSRNTMVSSFNSKLSHNLLLRLNIMRDTCDIICKSNFKLIKDQIIYEPTHPDEEYLGVDIENIKNMDSYNAPKCIPFVTKSGSINNILYKIDDSLRHDEIVSKIIMIFDKILIDEEKLDCYTVKYRVIALDSKSGLIEIVPNAETLESLKKIHNFSIQNYVRINNKSMSFSEWDEKIVKSCSFYSMISYLLGIGDRHLGNIMMTSTGQLFHIDFSYLLGLDPKYTLDTIRITSDMIDALGGINSPIYSRFEETCIQIYFCARRHFDLFINILSLLIDSRSELTSEYIIKILSDRFDIHSDDETAMVNIRNKLKTSAKSYNYIPADMIHTTSHLWSGLHSKIFSIWKTT